MLAHKTSQYYGLETSTAEGGDFAGRIIALRTPSSARPRPTRLSDLKLAEGASVEAFTAFASCQLGIPAHNRNARTASSLLWDLMVVTHI